MELKTEVKLTELKENGKSVVEKMDFKPCIEDLKILIDKNMLTGEVHISTLIVDESDEYLDNDEIIISGMKAILV
jgi:hypothetical protein